MNVLAMDHPAHNNRAGVIRIDLGQVLGRLRASAGHETLSHYLVTCAAVQFWADVLDACPLAGPGLTAATDQPMNALRRAGSAADRAAHALLRQVAVAPATTVGASFVYVPLVDDSEPGLLSKLVHPPMPECCGYDLADLELIAHDAKQLIDQVGIDRSILIIGIRTGGAYLAPLWKAALTRLGVADVLWRTVRPRVGPDAFGARAAFRACFERGAAPVVVVADDRPDTGATMAYAAAMLRAPGIDLWFASVGKLWRRPVGDGVLARSPVPLVRNRPHPRLWECLSPNEHPIFIDRLQSAPGLPALPDSVQLQVRCPHGEARYGLGQAWLPWSDPRVLNGPRPLVNPRKTPLIVVGRDGRALLHLRFIGECVFGRAEFQRVQEMDGERAAWFIDGYVVTVDIGATQPFKERFQAAGPSLRAELLARAAHWLGVIGRQVTAHAYDSPMVMKVGARWSVLVGLMRERSGPLPPLPKPLEAFLTQPVPWPGRTGKAIRSSLRYACGGWHWQVDDKGQLHRFQLEANWGGVSFPELELAAFVLENRLALSHAVHLASSCGLPYSSVEESLPLAALTIAEARMRSARRFSDSGRIAWCQDFHDLLTTIAELARIETHSRG